MLLATALSGDPSIVRTGPQFVLTALTHSLKGNGVSPVDCFSAVSGDSFVLLSCIK